MSYSRSQVVCSPVVSPAENISSLRRIPADFIVCEYETSSNVQNGARSVVTYVLSSAKSICNAINLKAPTVNFYV
jgi:hypothetical protein